MGLPRVTGFESKAAVHTNMLPLLRPNKLHAPNSASVLAQSAGSGHCGSTV